ncbi:hypothetical protein OF83DRAFT_1170413 [Amylostereum chailletii]|nr:hypothetical protein OF83DRAFT_1170413 [Amylostereum chailletii]
MSPSPTSLHHSPSKPPYTHAHTLGAGPGPSPINLDFLRAPSRSERLLRETLCRNSQHKSGRRLQVPPLALPPSHISFIRTRTSTRWSADLPLAPQDPKAKGLDSFVFLDDAHAVVSRAHQPINNTPLAQLAHLAIHALRLGDSAPAPPVRLALPADSPLDDTNVSLRMAASAYEPDVPRRASSRSRCLSNGPHLAPPASRHHRQLGGAMGGPPIAEPTLTHATETASEAPTTDTTVAFAPTSEQPPRFVEHVSESTVTKSEPGTAADVHRQPSVAVGGPPAPLATPPAQDEKALDPPPQHPAVLAAGAGVSSPADTTPPLTASEPTHFTPDVKEAIDAPARTASPKPILHNGTLTSTTTSPHARNASAMSSAARATSPKPGSTMTHSTRSADNPNGSTFANGAATAAPLLDVDETVHERRATAEEDISAQDEVKISKEERKHNRTLSKVIRNEAAAEKKALEVALKELGELQKIQKAAVKEESGSHTAHAKALADEHKKEMALLAARSAHEKAVTTLQSAEEALEASRQHARETTEMLRLKAEEVEHLRVVKGTDDRERAVKIRELVGDEKRGLSRFFGH